MRVLRFLGVVAAIAVVISVVGISSRPLHVRQDFYAVVAQVLPVFLLVLAFEARLFVERPHHGPILRSVLEQILTVTLLGEIFALIAVAHGSASDAVRGGVLTSLLLVLLLFGAVASSAPGARSSEDAEAPPR